MGSLFAPLVAYYISYRPPTSIMFKISLATCLLLAVVEGSYYGYGGYGGHGGHGYGGYDGYGYGGYGYGGYGESYGHGSYRYGYGYPSYGYGYPSYGYGYDYPSYGYGHGGSGYKYKRSAGEAEQVHVSGATGQTVVSPSYAYGSAPAYGSHAPSSYAPHSYAPYSYAPHYPRYSGLYTYPYVTATNAVYSSYPTPTRHGYSSHGYGNVGYATPTSYLYSRAQGYGPQGEVDGHYVAPYAYAPYYPSYYY